MENDLVARRKGVGFDRESHAASLPESEGETAPRSPWVGDSGAVSGPPRGAQQKASSARPRRGRRGGDSKIHSQACQRPRARVSTMTRPVRSSTAVGLAVGARARRPHRGAALQAQPQICPVEVTELQTGPQVGHVRDPQRVLASDARVRSRTAPHRGFRFVGEKDTRRSWPASRARGSDAGADWPLPRYRDMYVCTCVGDSRDPRTDDNRGADGGGTARLAPLRGPE